MSEISRFYETSKIFITGGTGFLGKILIEKLLRSTNVSTIYTLIREKKGKSIDQRMDEMFDDVIFKRLRQEKPKFYDCIIPISGDCSLADLGLSLKNRNRLIEDVDVVFNVAATVRFNENIKLAHTVNVRGTKTLLDIGKHIKNLKAFVHVSTAYSHCHLTEIDEKFYDTKMNYDKMPDLLDKLSPEEAEKITPKIIGNYPNTYTFTKGLAEDLIRKNSHNIPVAIIRPSIILSTYREPIVGWADNFFGPMGYSAGAATSLLRVMTCDNDKIADIVPVDMCANAMIAIGWETANHSTQLNEQKPNYTIYNYVSTPENPIKWGEFFMLVNWYTMLYPYKNIIWPPHLITTTNRFYYNFNYYFHQVLPAIIMDFIRVITGSKTRFLKNTETYFKMDETTKFFTSRTWIFHNENTKKLWKKLNEVDRQKYPFNMNEFSWLKCMDEYVKGVRTYLLRDPLETLPSAKTKLKRLQIIRNIAVYLKCVSSFGILWYSLNYLYF